MNDKVTDDLIPDIITISESYDISTKLNIQLKFEYDINELNSFGHRAGWKCVINEISKINNLHYYLGMYQIIQNE